MANGEVVHCQLLASLYFAPLSFVRMKRKNPFVDWSFAALFGVILSGCTLPMPDTSKLVDESLPQAWSVTVSGSEENLEHFWERWNDPVLLGLIRRAVEVNPNVTGALANLRSARASQIAATATLWPGASLGVGADVRRQNHRTTDGYDANFQSDWTLNLAGADWARADAKALRAIAAEMTLEHTRNLVAAETAQAYINYRVAEEKLAIAKANEENLRKTAEVAIWRAESGMGAMSEKEDALQRLETARARIPEIEFSMANYRNALARLTTMAADRINLNNVTGVPIAPNGIAVKIPVKLLMRRHDVRSALHNLEAAAKELQAAREDYFPSLGLRGSLGTTAASIGTLGASGTGIVSLIGSLSLPVINWGSLQAREEGVAAELDKYKSTYVDTIVRALEETDNALQGIRSAESRQARLLKANEYAEKSYEYASLEYRTGVGDYVTMLAAQSALLNARESLIANNAERSNQYVMLYRAMGGAWQEKSDNAIGPNNEKSE